MPSMSVLVEYDALDVDQAKLDLPIDPVGHVGWVLDVVFRSKM